MATNVNESKRLDAVSENFNMTDGFQGHLTEYAYQSIEPHLTGASCLELGPADGYMTGRFIDRFESVTCVEGSASFCNTLLKRYGTAPNFEVICTLFEEYETDKQFDIIVAVNVLEHVENPPEILKRIRSWAKPNTKLIISVPNARSFHRLLGVKMGMIPEIYALNEQDHAVGHRRVYDADALRADVTAGGWSVDEIVGSFFKVFSSQQSEEILTEEQIVGFYELGKDFPEHGTQIAAICSLA